MKLIPPFDTFQIEKKAGEYKDFEISPDDPYPLKGVTYPVDYGEIDGYIAEDGDKLDVFLGSDENGFIGFIKVARPDLEDGEVKVYLNVTNEEKLQILQAFQPVILEHRDFTSTDELLKMIEVYRKT